MLLLKYVNLFYGMDMNIKHIKAYQYKVLTLYCILKCLYYQETKTNKIEILPQYPNEVV